MLLLTAAFAANALGLWAAGAKDACVSAAEAADADAIRQAMERNPLAARDDSVRSCYGEALWRAGAWDELAQFFDGGSIMSSDQALCAAEAL